MLAIQVAALTAKLGGLLDRSSLQQIHNDYAFINILATGGYLPITFVLYMLQKAGHRSWYMFLLSACTVVVSAATLWSNKQDESPQIRGTTYTNCDHANPVAFCLGTSFKFADEPLDSTGVPQQQQPTLPTSDYSDFHLFPFNFDYRNGSPYFSQGTTPLIVSFFVLVLTLLDFYPVQNVLYLQHLFASPKRTRPLRDICSWTETLVQGCSRLVSLMWSYGSTYLVFLMNLAIPVAFLCFTSAYMVYLRLFQSLRSDSQTGIPINLSNWTFGQVVAITVWVPPLVQYMHLEISKSGQF